VELASALRDLLEISPVNLSHLIDLKKEFLTLGEEPPAIPECKALLEEANSRLQQDSLAQRDLKVRATAAQQLLKE
jgi:hypothetical protein